MIPEKLNLWLALLCLVLLSACGSPGPPLPPSLEVAHPVRDLHATRKGNAVTLTWTVPTKTTEGRNIRHSGSTEICRGTESMKECGTPVAKLPPAKASENAKSRVASTQSYTDNISSLSTDGANSKIVYAVNVTNSYGRSAGMSNHAEVPAVPTLAPPRDFRAQLSGEGVRLTWIPASEAPETAGLRFVYRIYRREAGTNVQVVAGEVPVNSETAPNFLDGSIEWEKTYNYHATVATLIKQSQGTEQQVEGDDTPEVTIVAHDVFPPAIPSGLEAGFSGPGQKPFIDLVWTPDTDADLAGYNVYRSENASEPMKVNTDLVRSPAFRDTAVVPGHEYTYSVSAVDARGNESAHSQPATEKVPEQ
jgi:hypothetical protein